MLGVRGCFDVERMYGDTPAPLAVASEFLPASYTAEVPLTSLPAMTAHAAVGHEPVE